MGGVVHRRRLLRVRGGSERGHDPRARRRRALDENHGVRQTFTGAPPRAARPWAVRLRAGPGSALSHETAAEPHGPLHQPADHVHVTVPASRRMPPAPGVVHIRLDAAIGWVIRACARRLTTPRRPAAALRLRRKLRRRRLLDNEAAADGHRTLPYGRGDVVTPCATAIRVARALRAGGWTGRPAHRQLTIPNGSGGRATGTVRGHARTTRRRLAPGCGSGAAARRGRPGPRGTRRTRRWRCGCGRSTWRCSAPTRRRGPRRRRRGPCR